MVMSNSMSSHHSVFSWCDLCLRHEWPWELFSLHWVPTTVNINLFSAWLGCKLSPLPVFPFCTASHFPFDTASYHLSPAFSSCFATSLFQNSHSSPLLLPLPPSLLQFLRLPELLEKQLWQSESSDHNWSEQWYSAVPLREAVELFHSESVFWWGPLLWPKFVLANKSLEK